MKSYWASTSGDDLIVGNDALGMRQPQACRFTARNYSASNRIAVDVYRSFASGWLAAVVRQLSTWFHRIITSTAPSSSRSVSTRPQKNRYSPSCRSRAGLNRVHQVRAPRRYQHRGDVREVIGECGLLVSTRDNNISFKCRTVVQLVTLETGMRDVTLCVLIVAR